MSDHKHDAEPVQRDIWDGPSDGGIYRVITTAHCSCGPGPYYYACAESLDKSELERMLPDIRERAKEAYQADPDIMARPSYERTGGP